jgi:hemolysin III
MSSPYAPAGATAVAADAEPPKPLLRGKLHLAVALLAPFGLVAMMLLSDSPRGYVGGAIFGATLIVCYSTSAGYHLAPWSRRLRGVMKRLDHAMIFALIAGTYTPFCLLVLGNGWGISVLCVVWGLAAAGMLMKLAWRSAPRWLGVAAYLSVGWIALVASPPIASALAPGALALLIAGGALYSIGGVVYALRRPDPFPRVFGYHEVFHALVVGGGAIHFALVAFYLL